MTGVRQKVIYKTAICKPMSYIIERSCHFEKTRIFFQHLSLSRSDSGLRHSVRGEKEGRERGWREGREGVKRMESEGRRGRGERGKGERGERGE